MNTEEEKIEKILVEKKFEKSEVGFWVSNMHNQTILSYPEEAADHFYELENDSWWFQHRNRCISAMVKKYHQNGCFVDLGGGNGAVTKHLRENNIFSIVAEPGVSGARNAVQQNLNPVLNCKVEDLVSQKFQFSYVGAFDVVEHIEDDLHFLKQSAEILSEGGHLFLTVPAFSFLWSNEDVYAGHFRRYSKSEIKRLVEASGFEVLHCTYFFSILLPIIFLFRSLPSLFFKSPTNQKLNIRNDHQKRTGLVGKIIRLSLSAEYGRLAANKNLLMGSSILLVAKKLAAVRATHKDDQKD
ncbi:MAG: class I SAM-dependent methyltransferase [Bdellovibrio sp.]|nr:class I SAM-dependent methyltransferase [Bdellovibrio sp.]